MHDRQRDWICRGHDREPRGSSRLSGVRARPDDPRRALVVARSRAYSELKGVCRDALSEQERANISAAFVDDGGTNYQGGIPRRGLTWLTTSPTASALPPTACSSRKSDKGEALRMTTIADNDDRAGVHRRSTSDPQETRSRHTEDRTTPSFNAVLAVPGFFWDETGRAEYGVIPGTPRTITYDDRDRGVPRSSPRRTWRSSRTTSRTRLSCFLPRWTDLLRRSDNRAESGTRADPRTTASMTIRTRMTRSPIINRSVRCLNEGDRAIEPLLCAQNSRISVRVIQSTNIRRYNLRHEHGALDLVFSPSPLIGGARQTGRCAPRRSTSTSGKPELVERCAHRRPGRASTGRTRRGDARTTRAPRACPPPRPTRARENHARACHRTGTWAPSSMSPRDQRSRRGTDLVSALTRLSRTRRCPLHR